MIFNEEGEETVESGMVLILLGAALAVLGGAWTAALLWIAAGLRRRGGPERGKESPGEREEVPAEELRRSAAMQEGFDNLMRYTVTTARGGDGPAPGEEL